MKNFENLMSLSVASLKQLTEILGIENGTRLYSFLNVELKK